MRQSEQGLRVMAPLSGPLVPLAEVPDPVFAGLMMGDGVAIEPTSNALLAPCDGVVTHLHAAGHAITLTAEGGVEILMHIGIDTVHLQGRGFSPRVREGARVRAGEVLIEIDLDRVAREAACLQTMVLIADGERHPIAWRAVADVEAGKSPLFTIGSAAAPALPVASPAAVAVERAGHAVVCHVGGLHARPAALVQAAARVFDAEVTLELGDKTANARSVVSLMRLGTDKGAIVRVRARGPAAVDALAAVVHALETPTGSHDAKPAGVTAAPASPAAAPPLVAGAVPPLVAGAAPPLVAGALVGVCAAPGLAVGRVVRLDAVDVEPPPASGDVAAELATLAAARRRVGEQLAVAVGAAAARGATDERDIFAAHEALLEDPEIIAAAENGIAAGQSAGRAYREAVRAQCAALQALSPLAAERAGDLRDLERRVLAVISGRTTRLPESPELYESSILVADDIALSQLAALPRERVAGLCTADGGPTSHVAILARAAGIPALVAIGPALRELVQGQQVLLDVRDGVVGRLDPAPDARSLAEAVVDSARRSAAHARAVAIAASPAITCDGHVIEVAANIGGRADAEEAARLGADGVGLLRTELLFLDRHEPPSQEEQRALYQGVVAALAGRPVIIRTLDVGGDKPLPFLPLPAETNPALGLRGIRAGLALPEILDTQLRALAQVTPAAACRVMLPMIADVGELLEVRARLEAHALALGVRERPQLGVMIEVPSAALLADQLAAHADFLSIGTNDLTQYALAMDRCHPGLAKRLDGLHPAVLRLIALTVQGAARHGKWVGVCGALASDIDAVPLLIGLGVTELSVSPGLVPEVKARVRSLELAQCREEAKAMLELTSATAVRSRVRQLWPLAAS
jgi:phosphoenolpyruvate-protein phosphotransferase